MALSFEAPLSRRAFRLDEYLTGFRSPSWAFAPGLGISQCSQEQGIIN